MSKARDIADINSSASGGDLSLGDNVKAIFGDGSDLQIYAVGGNSFIQDTGSGSLFVTGASGMYLQNGSNETYLDAFSNGAVRLFYDNAEKIATTSTGVDVTGTITSDGLVVDTNTLFVDAANNRVGVNNATPSAALDVFGDENGNQIRLRTASTEHYDIQRNNSTGSLDFLGSQAGYVAYVFGGADGEHMRIDTTGVNVTGDFTASGNVTAYSDERLKSNIKTIDNAVDTVKKLRGVTYEKDGQDSLGVIAQEVQKVLPELVVEGDEYLSVAYGNMVGLLIEAVKELSAEIAELKGE